jgi:regulator of sigma E protease
VVGDVVPNGPADLAGVQKGDVLLEADGMKLLNPAALTEHIKNNKDKPVTLLLRRGGETFSKTVTPRAPDSPPDRGPMLGIEFGVGEVGLIHPSPWSQVVSSMDAMLSTIGAVISPKSDISPQHLSGPVKILTIYYLLFKSDEGWRLVFWFTVLLNVNLAFLNLLPLPLLDGGHILLAIMEAVRRRPISARVLHAVQTAFAILLIGFMLYIAFYDLQELPWKRDKQPPIKFSPPKNS